MKIYFLFRAIVFENLVISNDAILICFIKAIIKGLFSYKIGIFTCERDTL